MSALTIAREALEQIAERGITIYWHVEPIDGVATRMHRCVACKKPQGFGGSCANRECLTAIARAALDDMRRSP